MIAELLKEEDDPEDTLVARPPVVDTLFCMCGYRTEDRASTPVFRDKFILG